MTFDPSAYKDAVREEWQVAAEGWHRWIPTSNTWLHHPTEMMLDLAEIGPGSRVIDIAAGDGGQAIAAAERVGDSGEVLATDIGIGEGGADRNRPRSAAISWKTG